MTTPISNINIFPKDQEGKFYTSFELPKYQRIIFNVMEMLIYSISGFIIKNC